MKKSFKTRLCAVGLAALMLVGAGMTSIGSYAGTEISASAVTQYTTSGEYVYTDFKNTGRAILKYLGNDTDVVIPSQLDGVDVSEICDYTFTDCTNLRSVTIPKTVKYITVTTFNVCGTLSSIFVDENNQYFSSKDGILYNKDQSVIRCYPSNHTGSESVTVPDSVTEIGNCAFYKCSNLKSISLPDNLTIIGYDSFVKCDNLTSIDIPKNVTTINNYAFQGCTSLTSFKIPPKVTTINEDVFDGCTSLTSIEVDKDSTALTSDNGVLYSKDKKNLIRYPLAKKDTSFTVPEGVETIAACAFRDCKNLKSVAVSEGVKKIWGYAFGDCHNLSSVKLADSIEEIGWGVFDDCIGLTDLVLPKNLNYIGSLAFSGCENLSSLITSNNITDSGFSLFYDCKKLVVYGEKNTYMETYAKKSNVSFAPKEIVYGGTADIFCGSSEWNKEYTFAVYYKQSTATKWTTAQKYSENREVSFKPKHTGIYNVCIRAKDSDGHVTKKIFNITVNPTLKNTSEVSVNSIKLGKSVSVTAASTGGLGEKVYEVFYKNSTQTKWTKAQSYSSNTSITIKPKHTGKYTICVKAKDERGKAVKKNLTVEVTK